MGKRDTFASGGKQAATLTYMVDMAIPFEGVELLIPDIVVSEFHYIKPSIRGLIGRDIICLGDFCMMRDRNFRFEI